MVVAGTEGVMVVVGGRGASHLLYRALLIEQMKDAEALLLIDQVEAFLCGLEPRLGWMLRDQIEDQIEDQIGDQIGDQIVYIDDIDAHLVINKCDVLPLDALRLVLRLLRLEHVPVELLLEPLVGVVDAQLLRRGGTEFVMSS